MDPNSLPRRIRVGVIDSGWDVSIADRRVLPGVGFVPSDDGSGPLQTDDYRDRLGHGTVSADLILQGAPNAEIVPIRVFDTRLETSAKIIAAALDWAVQSGLSLVNLSLATLIENNRTVLLQACERAHASGVIVVAAAFNHIRKDAGYPAVFENVIGVRALNLRNPRRVLVRPNLEIECGIRVIGRRARSLDGHLKRVSSNSAAAALVTGVIANLAERNDRWNLDKVRSLLADAEVQHPS